MLSEGTHEVPGQELLDTVDRMVSDAGQHAAQVELWIETVEFGGADQAVDRGGALATGIGASEQVIFPAQSDRA